MLRAKLRRADIDASAARTLRRLCGRSTHLATIFGVVLNLRGTLKLRNLSFLGSDQMDNLLKDHI